MALQIGGQISLSNIATEMNFVAQNISLTAASTSSNLNDQSPSKPDESQPHAMSEFFAYDHSYSSVKSMMGSSKNSNTRAKWFDSGVCDQDLMYFYSHDGEGTLPALGDIVYGDSSGNTPLANGYYKIQAGFEGGSSYAIQAGNNTGTVILIGNCAEAGGSGPVGLEPAPGEPADNDPRIKP